MQIRSTTHDVSSADRGMPNRLPLQSDSDTNLHFKSILQTAEKNPPRSRPGNAANSFALEPQSTQNHPDNLDEKQQDDTLANSRHDVNADAPLAAPPLPSIPRSITIEFKAAKATVAQTMIVVVNHIQALSKTYASFQFESADRSMVVKCQSIGDTMNIKIQLSDTGLSSELLDRKSELLAAINQAVPVQKTTLSIEPFTAHLDTMRDGSGRDNQGSKHRPHSAPDDEEGDA